MEIGEIACAAPAWSYRGCTLNSLEVSLDQALKYERMTRDQSMCQVLLDSIKF